MINKADTIVAQVTPEGRSGVGVLRVSGDQASKVSIELLGKVLIPRYASYLPFLDKKGDLIDQGIALWFPGPNSFTGEDILELHAHGSPLSLKLLLKRIISISDVRLAKPGEFSTRAFLNGKIDLAQAEGIIDLINATSEAALKSSLKSLDGTFSFYINKISNKIKQFRIKIETEINFSEEHNIDFFEKNVVNDTLDEICNFLKNVLKFSKQGSILRDGIKVVIVGEPNVGKSSLLNALSLKDRAIVTDIEGTTRDVLYEYIYIDKVLFQLADTAGLRITDNKIEKLGIERTWKEIKESDHILFLLDGSKKLELEFKKYIDFVSLCSFSIKNITIVLNKWDLSENKNIGDIKILNTVSCIKISALKNQGINTLRRYLRKESGLCENTEGLFLARNRHICSLKLAYNRLEKAKKIWNVHKNLELLAEDLKTSQNYLNEITGLITSDEILSEIFKDFCIGK